MATWEIVESTDGSLVEEESRFLNLPVEIHEIIGKYLCIEDMISLRSTCSYFENVYQRSQILVRINVTVPYWYYYHVRGSKKKSTLYDSI